MTIRCISPRRLGLFTAALAWATVVALPLWTGSALADAVVIRSTDPGLKAGQKIATGAKLTLAPGTAATLVSQNGQTIVLTGPFSGPVSGDSKAGDGNTVTALSRLLTASAADTSALGVTRAAPGMTSNDPYAIAAATGTHCQVPDRTPFLKRGLALSGAQLTITAPAGGQTVVDWPAGSAKVDWPGTVALADNAVYKIQVNGQPQPAQVTVRLVPRGLAPEPVLAAWMADHGCSRQARNLLATLK